MAVALLSETLPWLHLTDYSIQATSIAMTIQSLNTLPFDAFYQIATSLDDRDFVNLSHTSRALYSLSQSEQIARKTVEVGQVNPLLELSG